MSNVPNNVIIVEDSANQVIVNQDAPNQVVVRVGGGTGNTRRHVHEQASSSQEWTINHNLGGKPSVMVVDSANTVVVGEVRYISNTEIKVYFTAPFSGYAYLT
jgi:hypothetical protein